MQDVRIDEVSGMFSKVAHEQGLPGADDLADARACHAELKVWARPGAPLRFRHARGIRLELLSTLFEERHAHAIAGHDARDAARQCLKCQRDVGRTSHRLQHLVVGLELLDVVEVGPMLIFAAVERASQRGEAARRQGGHAENDGPADHDESWRKEGGADKTLADAQPVQDLDDRATHDQRHDKAPRYGPSRWACATGVVGRRG
jgi:hypothetical protein